MTAIHQSRDRAVEAAEKLKVYAQPQRLMILSRLLDGEYTVGEIEDATHIGQPALSQQLAELRRADLVETRRAAKQVFYRLANENVALCVRSIEAIFGTGRDVAAALAGAITTRPKQASVRRTGAATFAQVD